MGLNKVGLRLASTLFAVLLVACGEPENEQTNALHLERAKAYQEQGQYNAATIEYKNAVKKSGAEVGAITQYADMLNALGQHTSALNLLEQGSGQKTEAYYLELVETFVGLNKYLSAEATLKDYLVSGSREVRLLEASIQLGLGELKLASKLYDALLAENNTDNDALLGKAQVLVRNDEIDASLKLLSKIQETSDANTKAKILTAGIQISKNNLEAAETVLSKLLSTLSNTDVIEPEKAVVLERLSYVLTRQGRSNEAYIYTKILTEAFPGANEVQEKYQTAVEKFQAGEMNAAKGILQAILDDYPTYKKATQLLGVISYLRGDTEQASKYLSESVDPEVANPITKHIYAATNLKLNDPKKVLEILEPGIERSKVPATLALFGLAAISDKQYSKGEKALLRALEIEPNNIRIRLALAGFYRNSPLANSDKEWQSLQQAYNISPNDKQVLKDVVSYHLRFNGAEQAAKFIENALSKSPNDYATNLISGHFKINQNKPVEALPLFAQAVSVKKEGRDYMAALFAKGKTEIVLKKMSDAEKTFNEIVRVFPGNEFGYKGLLSVFTLRDGNEVAQEKLESLAKRNAQIAPYLVLLQSSVLRKDIKSANTYLNKIKALSPENKNIANIENAISFMQATNALEKNDLVNARKFIAPILVSEPDNLRVLSFLVDLELRAGKLNEASKILKQVEAQSQGHPVIILLKGDIALASENIAEAKKYFSKSWADNPSEAAASKLFQVLTLLKDTSAKNEHLSSWIAKFPKSSTARLHQAFNYQHRGQRIKALESYEKLLKISPNNAIALNNLGWIYFEKGDKRALELLKRAYELAPESAAVLDSYGWVLVKNGQIKEGLIYLEKANQLAPDVKEISDHLTEARMM